MKASPPHVVADVGHSLAAGIFLECEGASHERGNAEDREDVRAEARGIDLGRFADA